MTRCAYKIVKTEFCITFSQIFGGVVAIAGVVGIVTAGWFGVDWRVGAMGGMGLVFGFLLFMYARGTKGSEEVQRQMRATVARFSAEVDEFDALNKDLERSIGEFKRTAEVGHTRLTGVIDSLQSQVRTLTDLYKQSTDTIAQLVAHKGQFDDIVTDLQQSNQTLAGNLESLGKALTELGERAALAAERDEYRRQLDQVRAELEALKAQVYAD